MPDTPPSLLIRLRDSGDRNSWERFFHRYWRLIYSFARNCGLSSRDSEDIVQEVVCAVFQAMPTFNYDRAKGTFRAYLRTMTQRKIVDLHRRRAQRPEQPSHEGHAGGNGHQPLADPASPKANQAWERDWQRNLMQLALERVKAEVEPRTYQAFQLYVLEEWSVSDVAKFLKMSQPSVYTSKSRVVQRLRHLLEKEIAEDG